MVLAAIVRPALRGAGQCELDLGVGEVHAQQTVNLGHLVVARIAAGELHHTHRVGDGVREGERCRGRGGGGIRAHQTVEVAGRRRVGLARIDVVQAGVAGHGQRTRGDFQRAVGRGNRVAGGHIVAVVAHAGARDGVGGGGLRGRAYVGHAAADGHIERVAVAHGVEAVRYISAVYAEATVGQCRAVIHLGFAGCRHGQSGGTCRIVRHRQFTVFHRNVIVGFRREGVVGGVHHEGHGALVRIGDGTGGGDTRRDRLVVGEAVEVDGVVGIGLVCAAVVRVGGRVAGYEQVALVDG